MRAEKLHAGKVDVDVSMVRRLIAAQFPQWAHLPVREVPLDGWDNWTFRLGRRMKVRLPSAEAYVPQAEKEARWLPVLAPHLPLPVPVPHAVGEPGEGYPWPWSIYRWLEGHPGSRERIEDLPEFATHLGQFLNALHGIDAAGGPAAGEHSFFRGGELAVYDAETRRCMECLRGEIEVEAALATWNTALAAEWRGSPVWIHGDVAPGNLLVTAGKLSGVIDFGCSAVGDPACDLAIAWVFLHGEGREAFRRTVIADAGTWARARGWALWKALLVTARGLTQNPAEFPARGIIEAVLEDHKTG